MRISCILCNHLPKREKYCIPFNFYNLGALLICLYYADPESAFIFQVVEVRAGANRAGIKRAILKKEKNILEKSYVFKISHLVC